jgi:hypothetical protein
LDISYSGEKKLAVSPLFLRPFMKKLVNLVKEELDEYGSYEAFKIKQNEKIKRFKINYNNLRDVNNSPIQIIEQLRGYYNINPLLALSLTITIFSFVGIPPLIGFFAKQMVLSAALDSGYIFLALVAILTSVISAVYYLIVIKEIFFYRTDYIIRPKFDFNV